MCSQVKWLGLLLVLFLTACGAIAKYTITFETDGGTELAPLTISNYQVFVIPSDPTKEGHTFEGWFIDDVLSIPYDSSVKIDSDLTLYAKWMRNYYTIDYITGLEQSISESVYQYGDTLFLPTPTRAGYVFRGWATSETSTTPITWMTMPAGDLTLYPIWEDASAGLTELVIGLLLPLSGEYAEAGIQVYNGVQLAVSTINNAGGINGYGFRVIAYNTQGSIDTVVSLYNQLRTEPNLIGVIGGLIPSETSIIRPMAEQDGIAVITLDAVDKDITADNTVVYRIVLTDEQRYQMALRYVLEGIEADYFAILKNNDDSVSVAMEEAFRNYFNEQGITSTTYDISVDPFWYSTIISSIKYRGSDVIIAPGAQSYASAFMAQASSEGLSIPFIAVDAWNYEISPYEMIRILEDYHAAGNSPLQLDFVDQYASQYNENPTRMSALGYDAIQVIAAAVTNWEGGSFSPSLLQDVRLSTSVSGLIGFDETGDALKRLLIVEYQSGEPIILGTFE